MLLSLPFPPTSFTFWVLSRACENLGLDRPTSVSTQDKLKLKTLRCFHSVHRPVWGCHPACGNCSSALLSPHAFCSFVKLQLKLSVQLSYASAIIQSMSSGESFLLLLVMSWNVVSSRFLFGVKELQLILVLEWGSASFEVIRFGETIDDISEDWDLLLDVNWKGGLYA